MPTPVSSPNSSSYDPHALFTPADGGGSNPVATSSGVAAPREVSIPPVMITGDAGAQQLVQRHDAARQPHDCSAQGANAALSCGKAGLAAAALVASGTTVVGTALVVAATLAESISCGKDLRASYDCKTQ